MVWESWTLPRAARGALSKVECPYGGQGTWPSFFARDEGHSLSLLCVHLKDKNEPRHTRAWAKDTRQQPSVMLAKTMSLITVYVF